MISRPHIESPEGIRHLTMRSGCPPRAAVGVVGGAGGVLGVAPPPRRAGRAPGGGFIPQRAARRRTPPRCGRGGEWQCLAKARAFYRVASFILLDGPSGTLGSWSEAAWFGRFQAPDEGRTAVLITHRSATARRADLVHVMNEGDVVEAGSRDELLAQGGDKQSRTEQVASVREHAPGSPDAPAPDAHVPNGPASDAALGAAPLNLNAY